VIAKQLTTGVSLVKVEPMGELLLPPRAQLRAVTFPKPARMKGNVRTAAVAEFELDGAVVARATIPFTIDVSEDAIRPDAPRGTRVAVIADVGSVQITTSAVLGSDARIGDVTTAQIASTNRVVRVRLVRADQAHIVETP
jgi:flagella basal body P-ring formation protein FlgA